jgi:hypothetical protein
VLPPIDTSLIPEFKLPFDIEKYQENPLYAKFENQMQEDLYIIDERAGDEDGDNTIILSGHATRR